VSFVSSKQIYTPDLLVPGRKPVGPVAIDWRLPITKDLKFCFYPTDRNLRDLVSGRGPNAWVNNATNTWDVHPRGNSLPSFIRSSGLALHTRSYVGLGIRYAVDNVDPTKGITLAFFYLPDVSHVYDRGWGIGNTSGDYLRYYEKTASQIQWSSSGFGGGGGAGISPSRATGEAVLSGIRSNYNDTVDAAYGNQEVTLGTFTAANGINEIWFGLNNRTTTDTAYGSYYITMFWNRKLSRMEWQSLRKNPYQFIKPVGADWLNFGVEVVGGGLSIPVAYHHYSKNIGT